MCGITVVAKLGDFCCGLRAVRAMNDLVSHRGPDDAGLQAFANHTAIAANNGEDNWTLAMGHRRLSILDLTSSGRQPMSYRGRYWITYNGEVYNYLELRQELKNLGHTFCTQTDTEVVLAAYAEWGTDCYRRFNGMWGMVLYDQVAHRLVVSRDRLGIKPLYLHLDEKRLAIISEIKQLTALPGFSPRANTNAVVDFLASGYEEPTRTFFSEVRTVQPGTYQVFDFDHCKWIATEHYWFPENIGISVHSSAEATELFRINFEQSIKIRLRSDVQVGSCLSGGLDSSSIVDSVARQGASKSLSTFSVCFPGTDIDESKFVDQVVAVTNARSYTVTPTPEGFKDELDRFVWIHDEPVGGPSVFASYCVAKLARENGVTVILNGQGGDELLGGYWQSYFVYLWQLLRKLRLACLFDHVPGCLASDGNKSLLGQSPFIIRRYYSRMYRATDILQPKYRDAVSSRTVSRDYMSSNDNQRRLFEIRNLFLPRLLKWDDRNTMAFSVEGRYPFLDKDLIETCLRFSGDVLYHRGWTKWPLRRALGNSLPRSIVFRRSKFGLEVPQRDWIDSLTQEFDDLANDDLPVFQYVNRDACRQALRDFRQGRNRKELSNTLFRMFILDRWMARFSVAV